ncbi:MAG: hypothetical protein VW270_12835 [Candidatus Poseidoniales archaeon]
MDSQVPPFVEKIIENRSTVNIISIVMLLIAAWACLEIITNLSGSDLIPPETGTVKDATDPDGQRLNDGKVLFVGAVFGTLGVVFQLMIAGLKPETENVVVVEEVDEDIEEVVEMETQDASAEESTEEEGAADDGAEQSAEAEESEGDAEEASDESQEESEEDPVEEVPDSAAEEPKEDGDSPKPAGRKF